MELREKRDALWTILHPQGLAEGRVPSHLSCSCLGVASEGKSHQERAARSKADPRRGWTRDAGRSPGLTILQGLRVRLKSEVGHPPLLGRVLAPGLQEVLHQSRAAQSAPPPLRSRSSEPQKPARPRSQRRHPRVSGTAAHAAGREDGEASRASSLGGSEGRVRERNQSEMEVRGRGWRLCDLAA